nr:hypothetical protein [Ktedonobacterales bacterium]
MTPRLRQLAALITATGHRVALSTQMSAWLKTHAIFVTSMAAAIDLAGGDSLVFVQDRAAVVTMVRAIREGFQALQRQGIPITPRNL